MNFELIDLNTFKGEIPAGADLVIAEKGKEIETAMILKGFDEIELFKKQFNSPVYGFFRG